MLSTRSLPLFLCLVTLPAAAAAQTPAKEPPPLWDLQIGASFVGTSGNSDSSSTGADFSMHRRWPVWQIESEGELTAQAALNSRLALKAGYLVRSSHDPIPGFKTTDSTLTVSVVVRWKAATAAPSP